LLVVCAAGLLVTALARILPLPQRHPPVGSKHPLLLAQSDVSIALPEVYGVVTLERIPVGF
jgi:hypothetical protein